jgi:hypothetical protein
MMMADEVVVAIVNATNATTEVTAATAATTATTLQLIGAFGFGMLLGWYLYYINRNRKEEVKLADLATVIGAIGGTAVLALFDAKTDLFGAYGIGLAVGFFGYYLLLVFYVSRSEFFDVAWFLDGRKKDDKGNWIIPGWTLKPEKPTVPDSNPPMIMTGEQDGKKPGP